MRGSLLVEGVSAESGKAQSSQAGICQRCKGSLTMQTEDVAQNGLAPTGSFCSLSRTSSDLLFPQSFKGMCFLPLSLPPFFLSLCPLSLFPSEKLSCIPSWPQAHYTAKESFELLMLVSPTTATHFPLSTGVIGTCHHPQLMWFEYETQGSLHGRVLHTQPPLPFLCAVLSPLLWPSLSFLDRESTFAWPCSQPIGLISRASAPFVGRVPALCFLLSPFFFEI